MFLSSLSKSNLQWIFVCGKGGVGKTTIASSLAFELSSTKKVLLLTMDPSACDIFDLPLSEVPRQVGSLYVMQCTTKDEEEDLLEFDISTKVGKIDKTIKNRTDKSTKRPKSKISRIEQTIMKFPGMDETIALYKAITYAEQLNIDTCIIDTAPQGVSLRFINFPTILNTLMNAYPPETTNTSTRESNDSNQPNQQNQPNQPNQPNHINTNISLSLSDIQHKMYSYKKIFTNPSLTSFLIVCTSDTLSVLEAHKTISKLKYMDMSVGAIILNKLLNSTESKEGCTNCKRTQQKEQNTIKYLKENNRDGIEIRCIERMTKEIKGMEPLKEMGKKLTEER